MRLAHVTVNCGRVTIRGVQPRSRPGSSSVASAADHAVLTPLAGMLALASSLGIGRFVYTPILPSMVSGLGFGPRTAGLIASANFAGYLAGAVVATLPGLPGGNRLWFIGGLLTGAATTLGMAVASGVPTFLLLRFVGGASSAFVLVLGTASVLDALAAIGRTGLRSLHYAGVGFGIALSAMTVAWLEAAGAGWRTLWLGAGLIGAVMIPLPASTLRWRPKRTAVGAGAGGLGPGLTPITICHALFGFGYVLTATFLVAMARAAPSVRAIEPLLWMVVGAAAFPSMLLWDFVAHRIGTRPAYAVACLIEAAGVLAGAGWESQAGLLLSALLLGGTFMGVTALGFAAARECGAEGQERRFAVITVGFALGQAIGPALGGAVAERTGGFWVPSVLASCALVIASGLIVTSGKR